MNAPALSAMSKSRHFQIPLPGGWAWSVPAAMFGGLTGISAIVTGWFGLETWLLATGRKPITWYSRNYISNNTAAFYLVVTVLGFGLGAAVTHFAWDQEGGFKPKLERLR